MSVAIVNAGTTSLVGSAWLGLGDLATKVQHQLDQTLVYLHEPASQQERVEAFERLDEIRIECGHDNWDGDGAKAISIGAFKEAKRFLEQLPSVFPAPDITADPRGAIGFVWHKGKDWVYVASVSGQGLLIFSGLFGPASQVYGRVAIADSVPGVVLDHLRQLYG